MNCAICERDDSTEYLVSGIHRLVKCRTCGLIYVSNFGEISYAGEEYFTREKDYVRRWDEFVSIFEPLLDKIQGYKRGGVLLDVGAGVGILLDVAAKKGYVTRGVEISDWASAYARKERGLDVHTGKLEEVGFPSATFDVVVVNHVLEHVRNPKVMLSEIHRILKSDGLLVIGVPNAASIMAKLRGAKWVALLPEEHIWHFTADNLSQLVEMINFKVLHLEAKDNPPVFGWGLKSLLRRAINTLSVSTDRSETMLLFAEKKSGTCR